MSSMKVSSGLAFAALLSACMAHGPEGVAYSDREPVSSVGATTGSPAGGTVPTAPPKQKEKEERGNTPPGQDRTGHGPATGAIVDPSGVATGGKPY